MDKTTLKINYRVSKLTASNTEAMEVEIKSFVCPSASVPSSKPSNLGYLHYRANMGTNGTNGVMYRNSSVKQRDIIDDTTQTIAFGESLYGIWSDANSCCVRVHGRNVSGDEPDFAQFDSYRVSPTSGVQYFGFGSWHPDTVHFVFMDSHARGISKNIDWGIFRSLATRNGGEIIKKY